MSARPSAVQHASRIYAARFRSSMLPLDYAIESCSVGGSGLLSFETCELMCCSRVRLGPCRRCSGSCPRSSGRPRVGDDARPVGAAKDVAAWWWWNRNLSMLHVERQSRRTSSALTRRPASRFAVDDGGDHAGRRDRVIEPVGRLRGRVTSAPLQILRNHHQSTRPNARLQRHDP